MAPRLKEPKIALELRFDAAATPARVAATAQFLDRLLSAADPRLPADSVTLVVRNYSTVAGLRAWTPAGDEVLRRCERLLKNPAREVGRNPDARRLAAAVAEAAPVMVPFHARVAKPTSKKPFASITERYIGSLQRLAAPPTATRGVEVPMSGTTEIFSPVYRVGRVDEGKEVRARVRIDDRPYDVSVAHDTIPDAFDAAKAGTVVAMKIEGGWSRDLNNALVLDPTRARIIRVGAGWHPISGAEFVDAMRDALPDAFADLTDVIPGDLN